MSHTLPPPSAETTWLHFTPLELTDAYYTGQTTVAADRVSRPYLNTWIRLTAAVDDVRGGMDQSTVYLADFVSEDGERRIGVSCYFPEGTVEHLQRGQVITIEGRIDRIYRSTIALHDCSLAQ